MFLKSKDTLTCLISLSFTLQYIPVLGAPKVTYSDLSAALQPFQNAAAVMPAPRASSPLHVAFRCEEIQGPSATLAHETILCFLRQDHGVCLTQLDELPCFTNTLFAMSIVQHHIVKLRTPYTSFLRNIRGLVSKSPMNCFEERKAARHQSTALQDIPLAAIP